MPVIRSKKKSTLHQSEFELSPLIPFFLIADRCATDPVLQSDTESKLGLIFHRLFRNFSFYMKILASSEIEILLANHVGMVRFHELLIMFSIHKYSKPFKANRLER